MSLHLFMQSLLLGSVLEVLMDMLNFYKEEYAQKYTFKGLVEDSNTPILEITRDDLKMLSDIVSLAAYDTTQSWNDFYKDDTPKKVDKSVYNLGHI